MQARLSRAKCTTRPSCWPKSLISNSNMVFSCVALAHPGSEIPESSRARTNVGSAPTYSRIARAGLSAPQQLKQPHMSWLIWPFLHMRAESIREPQCRQMLLELGGPPGPSLTRLSSENQSMELKLTYRRPHLIGHVASTFIPLNASYSEGSVRLWWVAPSTPSCFSPSGRGFSTSRHEKKSLQMGDHMKSTVSCRHPWTPSHSPSRGAHIFHHLSRHVRHAAS